MRRRRRRPTGYSRAAPPPAGAQGADHRGRTGTSADRRGWSRSRSPPARPRPAPRWRASPERGRSGTARAPWPTPSGTAIRGQNRSEKGQSEKGQSEKGQSEKGQSEKGQSEKGQEASRLLGR